MSVDLVIQYALRMRRVVLSSFACLALSYFPASSHKRYDLRKSVLNIKCVFCFCLQLFFSETFLILRRIERDMIKNVYWSSCKVPAILVKFYHHHHVPERLGVLSCSLILKMKLVPPPLPWSSRVPSSF